MARILMCPPDHFRVGYAINPWMERNTGEVSPARARGQWAALHDAIAARADVALVDPVEAFPDMVFTADAGTVCNGVVVAARFCHSERRGEGTLFRRWFEAHDFRVRELPETATYEGGDVWLDRVEPWLWAGRGFRSSIEAHRLAGEYLGREVLSLELVDPRFYHLDTCCAFLTGGYVMYYPPALSADALALLESRVPVAKRIAVDADDARRFACNAVNIGETVIVNDASTGLRARLAAAGFEVLEVPVGEFIKAGGAARCLTLKLA